jgi:hypothetical protein
MNHHRHLSSAEIDLLVALASERSANGARVHPSPTLAKKFGVTQQTIYRHLRLRGLAPVVRRARWPDCQETADKLKELLATRTRTDVSKLTKLHYAHLNRMIEKYNIPVPITGIRKADPPKVECLPQGVKNTLPPLPSLQTPLYVVKFEEPSNDITEQHPHRRFAGQHR